MKLYYETIDGKSVVTKMAMIRGDSETLRLPLTIDGEEYTMQDGDTLTLTVRETPTAESPALIQITGAPGSNRIPIAHEDTAQLEPSWYSADIQLLTADGLRKTIWPDYAVPTGRISLKNMSNFAIMPEVTML